MQVLPWRQAAGSGECLVGERCDWTDRQLLPKSLPSADVEKLEWVSWAAAGVSPVPASTTRSMPAGAWPGQKLPFSETQVDQTEQRVSLAIVVGCILSICCCHRWWRRSGQNQRTRRRSRFWFCLHVAGQYHLSVFWTNLQIISQKNFAPTWTSSPSSTHTVSACPS